MMNARMCVLAGIAMVVCAGPYGLCQSTAFSSEEESDAVTAKFLASAEVESQRGVYAFYTQTFVDDQNERVAYDGSLFGVMRSAKIAKCTLQLEIEMADLFAGTVGKRQTGQRQDHTFTSATISLSPEIANALTVMEARPKELSQSRHTTCSGDRGCTFSWLRFDSTRAVMREKVVVNGSTRFDGVVDRVLVPVSSAEAAKELMSGLREIAGGRCG